MKKLLIAVLLSAPVWCMAQADTTRNKVQPQHERYATLYLENMSFSNKLNAIIDSGQLKEDLTEGMLLDKKHKRMLFVTPVAALNYMAQRGWELVTAYPRYTNSSKLEFIFKRRY